MDLKKTISSISQRNMSRREFLLSTGTALIAIAGVSTVLKAFERAGNRHQSVGYGSSPYGGAAEQAPRKKL